MNAYDIIKKPLLTEKTFNDIANKKYAFIVEPTANKTEIKLAIEQIFGVQVEKVNTSNYDGKLKRQGKTQGYTAKYKKAFVTLKAESKSIEFFDNLK